MEIIEVLAKAGIWIAVYAWTIFSWAIGLYGSMHFIRTYIIVTRGRVVISPETRAPAVEYGAIDSADITRSITCVGIWAGWFTMMFFV